MQHSAIDRCRRAATPRRRASRSRAPRASETHLRSALYSGNFEKRVRTAMTAE
jgi:hypothetical protein